MCGIGSPHTAPPLLTGTGTGSSDPFPQDIPVYDAHCHPTDTMPIAVQHIPAMRATTLTVMATRAQDQDLVGELARDLPQRVKPAFGWHPWFSYQLREAEEEEKDINSIRRHLSKVLTPSVDPDDRSDKNWPALDALARSLPSVRPLQDFIQETRARLVAHPGALVGEIGLDKAFRVPEPAGPADEANAATETPPDPDPVPSWSSPTTTPGTREGRRLSPFRVLPAHQVAVLKAQLELAAELQRPVSVHGVQAHGLLFGTLAETWRGMERDDVLSRRERRQIAGVAPEEESSGDEDDHEPEDEDEGESICGSAASAGSTPKRQVVPSICLHSFSAPVEVLRQYLDPHIPSAIYFSFSTAVNCGSPSTLRRTEACIAACPDDRLLVESDLHVAGPPMDEALEDMYRRVCAIKKWPLAEGVARIASNYEAFVKAGQDDNRKARRATKKSKPL